MGAEDGHCAGRHLGELFDEDGALFAQALDDMTIVDYLMPDIDWWTIFLERPLDDLNRPNHASTESSWLRQDDLHEQNRI
jgi:hypothetical protein